MRQVGDISSIDGNNAISYVQSLTTMCRTVLNDATNECTVATTYYHKTKTFVIMTVQCDVVSVEKSVKKMLILVFKK